MPKNKATLYNDILTKITSNGQGDITGAVLASVLNDFVGSFQNSIDDSSGGAAVVANIAARDALTGDDLWHGRLCYVLDASADVTVDAGAALYIYDEDNTDWIKLTEFESLDLDLSDYVTSAELTTALGGYVTKSGTVNMTNTAVWNFNNGAEVIQIDTPNAQVEWNTAGSANGYVVISGDGLYVEDDTQYNTTVSQTGVSAQSSTFLNEVTHNSVSFTDLGAVKTHEFVASADRITLQSDLAGFKGLMAGSDISANLGALSYVWKGWVENYVSTELVAYALDTDLTNYVAKAGSTMDNNADITFAGGGEVLGLPNTPSTNGSAVSKIYLENQLELYAPGNLVLLKAGSDADSLAEFNFPNTPAQKNIKIDGNVSEIVTTDDVSNIYSTIRSNYIAVNDSGSSTSNIMYAGYSSFARLTSSIALGMHATLVAMQFYGTGGTFQGINIYGSGSSGSGQNWISFGDWFDTSTPYAAIREWDGTDSDSIQYHGRLGHYWTVSSALTTAVMHLNNSGSLGLGTTSINTCAMLELVSTSKGLLPPRGTSTQRDAIGSLAAGLLFHNTTATTLDLYDGSRWCNLAKVLTNTATLNFPSTGAAAVSDLTVTVTGAAVGDVVVIGVPNGSVSATATFWGWVSAINTVTVRYSPKATEDPASGAFKVMVFKN